MPACLSYQPARLALSRVVQICIRITSPSGHYESKGKRPSQYELSVVGEVEWLLIPPNCDRETHNPSVTNREFVR